MTDKKEENSVSKSFPNTVNPELRNEDAIEIQQQLEGNRNENGEPGNMVNPVDADGERTSEEAGNGTSVGNP